MNTDEVSLLYEVPGGSADSISVIYRVTLEYTEDHDGVFPVKTSVKRVNRTGPTLSPSKVPRWVIQELKRMARVKIMAKMI